MKKISITLLLLTAAVLLIQAQQSVFLSPDIWLRADMIKKNAVTWTDASGNNHNAVPVAGFVLNTDSLMNFNKAVYFDGTSKTFQIPFSLTNSSQLTIVTVYQSKGSLNEKGIWSAKISEDQNINFTDQRITGPQSIYQYADGSMNFPVINATSQFWGNPQTSKTDFSITLGSATLPASEVDPFAGTLAEYMVFNRLLSTEDLQILESYLSLKYGITLQYTSYISSSGTVIWDYDTYGDYSQTVAGIGRDDNFSLNQKQSSVSDGSDYLVIAAGKLSATNDANTYNLKDGNFLVWGSNGMLPEPDTSVSANYSAKYPVMQRKWIMSATGSSSSLIPTQVYFKLAEPENVTQCFLVIDRSATGDFSSSRIEYVKADSIRRTGEAVFGNVKWDTDKSGFDLFTFSYGMTNNVVVAHPSCFNQANGSMQVEVMGGEAPFQLMLTDSSSNTVRQINSPSRSVSLNELRAGSYKLFVTDAVAEKAISRVLLTAPGNFALSLKDSYILPLGQTVTLSAAEDVHNQNAVFSWTGDGGFSSSGKEIAVSAPGIYKVSVCDSSGCSVSKSITVKPEGNTTYAYSLYPNPSDGVYAVSIGLSSISDVTVRVFDSKGIQVSEFKGYDSLHYKFDGYIEKAGVYYVEITSTFGKKSFKLLVNQ